MMEKTTTVTAKISPEIKKEANDVLKSLGLNMSTAINMVLTQTAKTGRLPVATSINELDNEIARQEVKNGNTHYIGDNIDDFNKWIDNL